MKTAVYPGTFDPMTNGHMDILRRASKLFEHVIVAVAGNAQKAPHFSLQDRVAMVEHITRDLPNVSVKPLQGLLVDFARDNQAQCILRGLRAMSDFDYEFQLAGINRQLANDIETLMLPASNEYMFLSSSIVRDIARHKGDISPFVDPIVIEHFAKS